MSNTQFVFLNKSQVPNRQQWQQAIDSLNFGVTLELDRELECFEDEGFSPCIWNKTDEDVGFEIFYETVSDAFSDDPSIISLAAGKDYCISLSWAGSLKDCAAAMIASCALVACSDAIVSFEGEKPIAEEKLVEDTAEIVTQALNQN